MMTIKEIQDWLNTLPDTSLVGIDEGGLSLQEVPQDYDPDAVAYLEVGGIEEEEEDL